MPRLAVVCPAPAGSGDGNSRGKITQIATVASAVGRVETLSCGLSVPWWSYMGEREYSRFVKGLAGRLRLGSGDTLLDLAGDCGASAGAILQLYRGRLNLVSLQPSASTLKAYQSHLRPRFQSLSVVPPPVRALTQQSPPHKHGLFACDTRA